MRIDGYTFGKVIIDGRSYTSDVIIYPDRVDSRWWRREGHELSVRDIETVIQQKPEFLIVGTGSPGFMKVLPETESRLAEEKIYLIVKPTDEACATYNQLASTKRVVACLHLTC